MQLISLCAFALAGLLARSFGVRCLLTRDLMPCHAVVLGKPWAALEPRLQAVEVPAHASRFWAALLKTADSTAGARFHEAFFFGDNEHLANELAALVLRGVKRATASSIWTFEAQRKRLPTPGDLSIVTNWAGTPLCVIETQSVELIPFGEVGGEFAAMEGEGDGSLSHWRDSHTEYFTRECARIGRVFTEDMPVACERFKLRYP